MDKERLMQYFDQHHLPKRDVLSRIPLGTSLDAFWQELQQRRRGKATMLRCARERSCWGYTFRS